MIRRWDEVRLFFFPHETRYQIKHFKMPRVNSNLCHDPRFQPTQQSDMLCTNSACDVVFSGNNRVAAGLSAIIVCPSGVLP